MVNPDLFHAKARDNSNHHGTQHDRELWRAAEDGDVDGLEVALANGAAVDSIDESGWTSLLLAIDGHNSLVVRGGAGDDHIAVARVLLENSAQVNALSDDTAFGMVSQQ